MGRQRRQSKNAAPAVGSELLLHCCFNPYGHCMAYVQVFKTSGSDYSLPHINSEEQFCVTIPVWQSTYCLHMCPGLVTYFPAVIVVANNVITRIIIFFRGQSLMQKTSDLLETPLSTQTLFGWGPAIFNHTWPKLYCYLCIKHTWVRTECIDCNNFAGPLTLWHPPPWRYNTKVSVA